MTAEASPDCGQSGRVGRVFWRAGAPWILMHADSGRALTVPWSATNLPRPMIAEDGEPDERQPLLLSAPALLALVRFLQQRSAPAGVADMTLGRD